MLSKGSTAIDGFSDNETAEELICVLFPGFNVIDVYALRNVL